MLKDKCSNHKEKNALSKCHSCDRSYCKDCLVEGVEYFYCYLPDCQIAYQKEMDSNILKMTLKEENKQQLLSKAPIGVGGFISFFCFGLTILGPLVFVGRMKVFFSEALLFYNSYPNIKLLAALELSVHIIVMLFGIVAGVLIWSGSKRGLIIAKKYLLYRIIAIISVEVVTLLLLNNNIPNDIYTALFNTLGFTLAQEVVHFTVWWNYFNHSKRVKRTYANNLPE